MKKKVLSLVFLCATIIAFGQSDTISSTLTNTNSGTAVSFEVTATSATDIVGISNLFHTSASASQVWIRTGGVGGTAGGSLVVNAANGWTLHQSFTVVGSSTTQVWLSNLTPISIPAGTTMGIVLTGNMYYHGSGTTAITPNTFVGSFATLGAGGPTNGFGGSGAPPIPMSFTPRGFIGAVALTSTTPGSCAAPTNFTAPASTIACTSLDLTWSPNSASIVSELLWGVAGFDPATGGSVIANAQSPETVTGLMPGTAYDFYLRDSCSFGWSPSVFLAASTLPMPTTSFTQTQTSTTSVDAVVTLDATASTDYTTVNWEFGDGTPDGTNVIENHTYTQNQAYTVTLTLTNACGSIDSTFTVTVARIGIDETALGRSLNIFPNPTCGAFTVAFDINKSTNVRINVLDIYGRLVAIKDMGLLSGEQNIALDLSSKANGIYIVQIVTDKGAISRRVALGS